MAGGKTRRGQALAGTSRLVALVVFILVALAAGWLGSIATVSGLEPWYAELAKPGFTPPNAIFPLVWSILYVVIGVGGWLVWLQPGSVARNTVLLMFFVQLALNTAWSWAFFGLESIVAGLVTIVALFIAIAAMVLAALPVSRFAALLFLPYLVWVGFATALNATIYFIN